MKPKKNVEHRTLTVSSRAGWLLALGLAAAALAAVLALRAARSGGSTPASGSSAVSDATSPAAGSSFAPTVPVAGSAPPVVLPGMVWIPGGEFSMGSSAKANHCAVCPA